jgi:hypothetical protein
LIFPSRFLTTKIPTMGVSQAQPEPACPPCKEWEKRDLRDFECQLCVMPVLQECLVEFAQRRPPQILGFWPEGRRLTVRGFWSDGTYFTENPPIRCFNRSAIVVAMPCGHPLHTLCLVKTNSQPHGQ